MGMDDVDGCDDAWRNLLTRRAPGRSKHRAVRPVMFCWCSVLLVHVGAGSEMVVLPFCGWALIVDPVVAGDLAGRAFFPRCQYHAAPSLAFALAFHQDRCRTSDQASAHLFDSSGVANRHAWLLLARAGCLLSCCCSAYT